VGNPDSSYAACFILGFAKFDAQRAIDNAHRRHSERGAAWGQVTTAPDRYVGMYAGTPDFSGTSAKPAAALVVAKQLFSDTHGQLTANHAIRLTRHARKTVSERLSDRKPRL
jgi:hypothetical protein